MVGKLFLINLNSLSIGEFRVINAHLIAKNTTQTFSNLGGQRNLGQEVQHLFTLCDSLTDEMNVYFGLTARSNSMKQSNIVG